MSEPHLTHEELVTAAVDLNDLAEARRTHLNACPDCRRRCDLFLNRFMRIGRMAENLAPKPARPFRLPERQAAGRRPFFKPFWMIGFTAAMLLAIVIWQPQRGPDSQPTQVTAADLAQDRQLMQSIDALVENSLPAPYQALASVNSPLRSIEAIEEDDFLDWIVPNFGPMQHESLS